MYIKSFEFEDLRTGWKLERAEFDRFNLLVGNSGVGKTKILRALARVVSLEREMDSPARWTLEFRIDEHDYRWVVEIEPLGSYQRLLKREILVRDEQALFERGGELFLFKGQRMPLLNNRISGIQLLSREETIRPVIQGFSRLVFNAPIPATAIRVRREEEYRLDLRSQEELTEVLGAGRFDVLEVALMVGVALPDLWAQIQDTFCAIFHSVSRVAVNFTSEGNSIQVVELELHERSAREPIPHEEISSGMRRTLGHLIEVTVAPRNSAILIDEFENGLGANCMPDVVHFLDTRPDIQFIVTSHHPYVIDTLPIDTWKLVQRRGSTVRMLPASQIPALQEKSHHERYLRLINLPEFEEGIA